LSILLPAMKFIGIIAIVSGLALTFVGSKFIPIAFGFTIGFAIFSACFVLGAAVIGGMGATIGFAVVGLVLGGAAGYFSGKLFE